MMDSDDEYGQFVDLEQTNYSSGKNTFDKTKRPIPHKCDKEKERERERENKYNQSYEIFFVHIFSCISITILLYYSFRK